MDKITLKWANDEKTVLLITYTEDGWTWDDSFKALEVQRDMIEASPALVVDVLIDARNSTWMPRGGNVLTGIRKVSALRHARQGQTIFVGATGILASMADLMMKILDVRHREFQFAQTMEQADALLSQIQAARQKQNK